MNTFTYIIIYAIVSLIFAILAIATNHAWRQFPIALFLLFGFIGLPWIIVFKFTKIEPVIKGMTLYLKLMSLPIQTEKKTNDTISASGVVKVLGEYQADITGKNIKFFMESGSITGIYTSGIVSVTRVGKNEFVELSNSVGTVDRTP